MPHTSMMSGVKKIYILNQGDYGNNTVVSDPLGWKTILEYSDSGLIRV